MNLGDDGEPWPVFYFVFELNGDPPDAALEDPVALTEDQGILGESLLHVHEHNAFPGKSEDWVIPLDPETSYVLVAALYRRVVGSAWFFSAHAPEDYHQRVCDAEHKKEPAPPPPCLYVYFDGYEVRGGPFPPPGLDVSSFQTSCATVLVQEK